MYARRLDEPLVRPILFQHRGTRPRAASIGMPLGNALLLGH
jgi:hypothetical protein